MTAARTPAARVDPVLLGELENVLRAEIGARAIYPRLARATRDRELAEVLDRFHQEECEQVLRLAGLIRDLGGRARPRSLRRSLVAWSIALSTRIGALPLCLRLCHESETTVERWYRECARFLAHCDRLEDARACEDLALTKYRHARILEAWVAH